MLCTPGIIVILFSLAIKLSFVLVGSYASAGSLEVVWSLPITT